MIQNDKPKIKERKETEEIPVLLVGNPNVGKSTLFNALTGLHQHTGNWTGKTVTSAEGFCRRDGILYRFTDLPGCYSLEAKSPEEAVARETVYRNSDKITVAVCDCSVMERNFLLFLQAAEISDRIVLCVNLADEAAKKGITVNTELLGSRLDIPIVTMSARNKGEGRKLLSVLPSCGKNPVIIPYDENIEAYIKDISAVLCGEGVSMKQARCFALRLLDSDKAFTDFLIGIWNIPDDLAAECGILAERFLKESGGREKITDNIRSALLSRANILLSGCISKENDKGDRDRRIDSIVAGKYTGIPFMLLLLFLVLWLTLTGASYPSDLLAAGFNKLEYGISQILTFIGTPPLLRSLLCEGLIRVVGWVVSVMLPPMAIFFPLFTLLEDAGYLPRAAFHLDKCFMHCKACGKQALTMCMGLGCNATGVIGCRIIDSERERDLALLTNCFMPCNGRFPILIAMLTIFFTGTGSIGRAFFLTLILLVSVAVTLLVCRILSATICKGVPSSFTLELPSYRMPQIGSVVVHSVFDRTLKVLGRAVTGAVPCGILIWLLSHIHICDTTLISAFCGFLDPLGKLMGLDGVILCGFILGIPANEIVIPVILLCYLNAGGVTGYSSLSVLGEILRSNGWTVGTAVSMIIFTVFHWPCATTAMTMYKETASLKKTALGILLPTSIGIVLCITANGLFTLFR